MPSVCSLGDYCHSPEGDCINRIGIFILITQKSNKKKEEISKMATILNFNEKWPNHCSALHWIHKRRRVRIENRVTLTSWYRLVSDLSERLVERGYAKLNDRLAIRYVLVNSKQTVQTAKHVQEGLLRLAIFSWNLEMRMRESIHITVCAYKRVCYFCWLL